MIVIVLTGNPAMLAGIERQSDSNFRPGLAFAPASGEATGSMYKIFQEAELLPQPHTCDNYT